MRVVVLVSGGLDSAALVPHARASGHLPHGLWIDYGQPAGREEGDAARNLAAALDFPLHVARVTFAGLGHMIDRSGDKGPRVVPGRNAVLVALAVNYAVTIGASAVWLGATKDDAASYPDCRLAFVAALSDAMHLAIGVRVAAPFSTRTKREVATLAADSGLDPRLTWSCYCPRAGEPCDTCDACVQRGAALA